MSDPVGIRTTSTSMFTATEQRLAHLATHVGKTVKARMPAIIAAILGVLMLATVGFAPSIAHKAAHDVRHLMAFPCH